MKKLRFVYLLQAGEHIFIFTQPGMHSLEVPCMWSTPLYRPNNSIDCPETSHSFHQSLFICSAYCGPRKLLFKLFTQVTPVYFAGRTPFRVRWPLGQLDLPSRCKQYGTAPLRFYLFCGAAEAKSPLPAAWRMFAPLRARRRPGRPVTMMLPASLSPLFVV